MRAPGAWLREYADATKAPVTPAVNVSDPALVATSLRLYRELRSPDVSSPWTVEELLAAVLGAARELEPPLRRRATPGWLRRAREVLHDASPDGPGLAELADLVGVHRVHLARTFRRHYGTTVGEYARGLRLRRAERELAEGDRPLGEIALRAGFYDQSHFNRHFRRATGMTPGRFRSLLRGD